MKTSQFCGEITSVSFTSRLPDPDILESGTVRARLVTVGRCSKTPVWPADTLTPAGGSEVGTGTRGLATLRKGLLLHLLELLPRRHLLGEQCRLDSMEQPLQPAD